MSSFVKEDGTVLNKTELYALATEQTQESIWVFNEDVHQLFTQNEGNATFEGADALLFHAGQRVPESVIEGLFKTATVTSIVPNTGAAAGGTVVTINGTNLGGTEGVTFGGTAGTAFKRISDTRVQVTTPAKTAGAYNVVVQDDAGNVTVTNGFTYS
ncbi:IPT/TIG domain-containing protein [Actinophytocola sp.]|uniref:IPT/TIG domain-containing protein n=1 Tax=Actinophytocola sp. TaxID=1872138 RepID=UPI002D7EAE3F|nr:IPT/TIG domain-containing protein [Actinophytocola sp.]HET9144038.1 IPT/TIG domain-containing protein [Actinophytocola sp.]